MGWSGQTLHGPHDAVILIVGEIVMKIGEDAIEQLAAYDAPVSPDILRDLFLLALALMVLKVAKPGTPAALFINLDTMFGCTRKRHTGFNTVKDHVTMLALDDMRLSECLRPD